VAAVKIHWAFKLRAMKTTAFSTLRIYTLTRYAILTLNAVKSTGPSKTARGRVGHPSTQAPFLGGLLFLDCELGIGQGQHCVRLSNKKLDSAVECAPALLSCGLKRETEGKTNKSVAWQSARSRSSSKTHSTMRTRLSNVAYGNPTRFFESAAVN